ncbi:MAG: DUF2911 domain-containing protein [Gemmatimonadaceae bacterium]
MTSLTPPKSMTIGRRNIIVLSLGVMGAYPSAGAQVRASERSTISQTSDGTVVTVDYSRPRARGREQLYGKVIEWGEVWTPGANWATTLQTTRDITLGGHAVPKGKYSVWFVVRPDKWTFVLDPRVQLYHEDHPDSTAQQLRWTVTPTTVAFTEILTWSIPEVRPDGLTLNFAWGTMQVSLDATVQPSHPQTIARDAAQPYLGTYKWKWVDKDTTDAGKMTLYYDGASIRQRYDPFPDWYKRLQDQVMVRINDDWFIPSIVRDGKLWEMAADMVWEFKVQNGVATTFEIRDDKDNLMAIGERVKP